MRKLRGWGADKRKTRLSNLSLSCPISATAARGFLFHPKLMSKVFKESHCWDVCYEIPPQRDFVSASKCEKNSLRKIFFFSAQTHVWHGQTQRGVCEIRPKKGETHLKSVCHYHNNRYSTAQSKSLVRWERIISREEEKIGSALQEISTTTSFMFSYLHK